MNLTRVLNVALPDIPARNLSERPPRKPPDMVSGEHEENGERVIRVVVANQDSMYRFPPANWALIQHFDGERSYEEIAESYSAESGYEYSAEEIREFADTLESLNFWYKTPQEKNVLLMQRTSEERKKLLKSRKSKFGDLAEITFPAVNPDGFVTWLYKHTRFIYTWWFTVLTMVVFGITAGISVAHWDEIGRDTVEFFAFTHKTWGDVAIFYILAVFTLCWHELGHAHACKHYGGRVPAMGFLLIYLTPAFYTDTSEGFVKGNRFQRFIIAMAGAYSELYICAIATPIWWVTPPGSAVHNAAYLLMLMSGIAGLLINWNPLMKLDGYHMMSEALGVTDLKENSTAYLSAWVKRHVWGLPVEVPYVPKRRRLGFAVYAILSGAYSYTVLYILARFAGNIFRNFNPEWSFIPELAVAALIFRSRIRKLVEFMRFLYLDKKDRIAAWVVSQKAYVAAGLALAIALLPLWRESAEGKFMLEAGQDVIIRNPVAGTIVGVDGEEGSEVKVGTRMFELENLPLQSKVAVAQAELGVSSIKVKEAQMRYGEVGEALQEREGLGRRYHEASSQAQALELTSPIAGKLMTPRLSDWQGSYVSAGTELAQVSDLRRMRARIYVSDYDMYKLKEGAGAAMTVEGFARIWNADVSTIMPVSSSIDPAIAESSQYKGLNPLNYYVVELEMDNADGLLRPGMRGTARIYGQRRSLLGHAARECRRFFGRKIW